jgi:hypothetical protein
MRKYSDYGDPMNLTEEQIKKVDWLKFKIIVPTEEEKKELMEVIESIHYSDINTDIVGVNQIAHEYIEGNNIIVDEELYKKLND